MKVSSVYTSKKHERYSSLILKSWFGASAIRNSFCQKIDETARLFKRIGEEETVSLQYFLKKKFQLIGMEGTRLLRGKRGQGRPRRRTAEGGPPAESECLEWKSLHITLSLTPFCRQTET
ncbi:hypothetical protein C6W19_23240 [Bacillus sp. RJGP41]|nr:hypothetical protein C6W19_23240 [Bacillus sp. RJGP41]